MESIPSAFTLTETVASSASIFFRKIVSILGPGFLCFLMLSAVDLGLTALTGVIPEGARPVAVWTKEGLFVIGFLVCTALSIGFGGAAVLRALDGKPAGAADVLRETLGAAPGLISGTILFNLIVVALGAPGGWVLYQAFRAFPNLPQATGLLVLGCALLYYPCRLIMQWLFFGFLILDRRSERRMTGWQSLCESRRMMLSQSGPRSVRPMFRAFIVLKLSLVPALAAYIGILYVPAVVIALVVGLDEFRQALMSGTLNFVYAAFQLLHSAAWAIMIPIFVVPLAVVYATSTARAEAARELKPR